MEVKCQCFAVHFTTPTPAPLALYHCHCNECRKQSSSAFGTSAIFPAAGLFPLAESLAASLGQWSRPSKSGGTIVCYFCRECGSRVMHRDRDTDGKDSDTVCIKGGLITGLDYSKAHHIWTQEAVVPIPEGVKSYRQSPPPEEEIDV